MEKVLENISKIPGVVTVATDMFRLHEMYVDEIQVAYIRVVESGTVEVLTLRRFAPHPCYRSRVDVDGLNGMINKYRNTESFT